MDIVNFVPLMKRDPALLVCDATHRGLAEQSKMLWSNIVPDTAERFQTVFVMERLEDSLYPMETLKKAYSLVNPGGYILAIVRGGVAFQSQNVKLKLVNQWDKKTWKATMQSLGGELRLAFTVRPEINIGQWYWYFIVRKPLS